MNKQTNHPTKKKRSTDANAMRCIPKALKAAYADLGSSELPQQIQELLRELDSVGWSLQARA